ncbi:hypothetical protein CK500_15110 [Halorubrum salipaludis]|uniref:Uncharacterized protein n=1 Tax=Halorubrum salipaludis TaxID=2032630 RepID=A0A2A2F8A5_9EURY|nr:hypothetical protein [Halorubrum salipaludis]PAU80852.1 hypothetical protein CK500_15110 [Halorubrum salipaludis]
MSRPAIDLETDVVRDRPLTQEEAKIQVALCDDDPSQLMLSVGGSWGVTFAELTPTEARAIATALEHTAVRAAAATEASTDE